MSEVKGQRGGRNVQAFGNRTRRCTICTALHEIAVSSETMFLGKC